MKNDTNKNPPIPVSSKHVVRFVTTVGFLGGFLLTNLLFIR